MRENNRNSIEKCRKKLPQFTTMNVIDGQAGLISYFSLIFYSLTIDNILNIIIVLLILAGVSIATLTGDNGLLNKAGEAKEQTEVAEVKDRAQLDILDWQANQLKDNNDATLNDDIVKGILEGKDYISGFNEEDTENIKVITENGYEFPISDLYDKEDKAGGDDVKVGEDFTDSNGNEWVWIEVPKTEEVYKTAGLTITSFTDEEYTKIYDDLASYAGTYRGSDTGTDEWYDGSGNNASNSSNSSDTTGCGLTNEEYIELKQKMLKSVYENGGFHIGKYEVGIKEENTVRSYGIDSYTKHPINETPVIQANKVVYNWVRASQAQELSERLKEGLNLEDKEISLMFGIQWDLVLKYIETQSEYTKDGTNTLIDQTLIKSDSTKWGNYSDATFTVTNTNAKYSENKGASYKPVTAEGYPKSGSILLTTGATERNSVAGIYDIAGNVEEWTLEKTTNSSDPCSYRGGLYGNSGSDYPASYRSYSRTYVSDIFIGFRPALY